MMNSSEFVSKLKEVSSKYKTLYVMGCFGAPMTASNKKRYTTNHSYNKKIARTNMIMAASSDTFGFDCVNLIKGILWGWNGAKGKTYGGAVYRTNGVPDIGADSMITKCSNVSTNFSKIAIGEAVWMPGHIGIYIGSGLVIECSPKWKNGVQITACNRDKKGYNRRNWVKHGKLPWVEYGSTNQESTNQNVSEKNTEECIVNVKVLKHGAKGDSVKALQHLLIGYGFSCGASGADGSFGSDTLNAVKAYQKKKGLTVDGSVGPNTWNKLLGIK